MKYLFDRTYLLNRQIIVYREGEEQVRIGFDGFNGSVPEKTRFSFANGTDMDIRLREPEYDTEIPSEYFREIDHNDNQVLPLQDLLKRFDPSR
jgi:hypothetical protein